MTVSELIEWLKTQDQGAVVMVVAGEQSSRLLGDVCSEVIFTEDRFSLSDWYVKRTLLLGEMP